MKLVGLLSFYDEPVEDLVACITALWSAGATEIVALDGAYGLYPDGRAASHPNQHAAIHLTCRELGVGCTLRVPAGVWEGNEVEKRNALFALAWTVAEPGDWYWVMDADQVVTRTPADFLERLERSEHDAAEIEVLDVVAQRANRGDWPARFAVRNLFRAQPITVETNHCTYVAADGRYLWGGNGDVKAEHGGHELESCLDLTADVVMEHRPDRRPRERQLAKLCYYRQRDEARIERGTCSRCGAEAVRLVPARWKMTHIGPVAQWAEACEACAEHHDRASRVRLRQMGVDPDTITVENRNGHAPAGMAVR